MSKKYIDTEVLKHYIRNDRTVICTNKGWLIDLQAVLDDIDVVSDMCSTMNLNNTIDIKKWKRKLYRSRQHLKQLRDNESNLSEWGKHDLGYFKGYVSALENLFDELGMEVDE